MMTMHNPAHPGKVLREYIGDQDVTQFASHIKVTRNTMSRILNGRAGISADMSLRLSDALGTNPSFWLDMQTQYDLWHASRRRRPKIERIKIAA